MIAFLIKYQCDGLGCDVREELNGFYMDYASAKGYENPVYLPESWSYTGFGIFCPKHKLVVVERASIEAMST